MKTAMHSKQLPGLAIALGLITPLHVSAQDIVVEEVLVTAQRRVQNIMEVPLSVASYSPEQLEQQGIRDIGDVARLTPSLRFARTAGVSGNNGSDIRNGVAHQLKAGDVVVIPAGTGHWFTKIDDHINYLMIRIDPDKVTPLRSEAQSQAYLSKVAAK